MTRIDFTPMFRTTVGFDRMMNVMDQLMKPETNGFDYPPYNIEKTGEDHYRITLAVAGYNQSDLDVEVRDDTLYVRGNAPSEDGERQFLHRGIVAGKFERRFALADHVKVTRAQFDSGMLTIELVHEIPEAKRPRKIEIGTIDPPAAITSDSQEKEQVKKAA